MVLRFWIWSLRRDCASLSEYPSPLAKSSVLLVWATGNGRWQHTSFEFELPAEDVHQQLHNGIHRGQRVREEKESNHNRLFLEETERLVQGLVVHKRREQREDVEHVCLSNQKQLGSVVQAPVAELMAQDSNHLIRLALLDQSIIDHNVLLPRQSIEVGIAMSTALAAIDNIQGMEREVQFLSKRLDPSLQLTRLKGRELVEQRQDNDRVDGDGKDLDEDSEQPEIVEERVPSPLDDLHHGADKRSTQHNAQSLTLQHVRNPELDSLLVEPEFLLQHERLIVRDREPENRADDVEYEQEEQRLRDLALESRREVPCQP